MDLMNGQKKDNNFLPIAITGLIIILGILVIYPKLNKSSINSSGKVTVENEFNQPQKNPTDKFIFTILNPENNSIINQSTVTISGKTLPEADIYVNEIDGKADNQGNFSIKYSLEEGENYIVVGANDSLGNYAEKELVLNYEP